MKRRLLIVLVMFLGLAAPPGCSSRTVRKDMGIITGKVIFQGAPLPGGNIHFFHGQDRPLGFPIRGDGTFVAEVPVGPARVAVETESAKYQGDRDEMMKKWRERAGEYVHLKQEKMVLPERSGLKVVYKEIPTRFAHPDKSGLTHDVVPGEQQRDFELK
jgi:hypothetical protein